MQLVLLALALFALTLAAFWPGVSGGFVFDDYHNIVTNAHVQLKELSPGSLWRAANAYSGGTRQLAMASFALNAYWAGLDPWAYKLTGLLVHALNAVLVFFLARRILALGSRIDPQRLSIAAAALALVWAVHPLQVSSVLYIVQRMETLCYSFLLVALLLYLRARVQQIESGRSHIGPWLGATLAWLGAWLCKETAVLLPLFTLALEASVLDFGAARAGQRRFWRLLYGAGTLLAALGFIFWAWPHYYHAAPYPGRDFNTAERLLTQGRVLMLYLQQSLLPLPGTLHFYYDNLPLSTGWLAPPTTLLSAVALLAALVLSVLARRRYPLAALGVWLFLAAHFLTSNVVGLEMAFEHRNYFALLGVLLACTELVARLPVRDGPGIKYLGIAALVLGIGILGAIRAATWGNVLLLASDMVDSNPQSARARMDLGVAYYELAGGDEDSPFFQFAARQFDEASRLPGVSTQPDVNLILMHASGSLPDDLIDIDQVWQRYLQRLGTLHLSVETRTSVWSLLEQRMKGRNISDEGLQRALAIIFERSGQDDFRHAQAADYYLAVAGNRALAIEHYEQAIRKARKNHNTALIDAIDSGLLAKSEFDLLLRLKE